MDRHEISSNCKRARLISFIYLLSLLVVSLGYQFSKEVVLTLGHHWEKYQESGTSLNPLANWDGVWYQQIAVDGYSYGADEPSNVVFFPAYPLAGRFLASLSGSSHTASLLAVSHLCLFGAYVLIFRYIQRRDSNLADSVASHVLLCLALWPVGVFFHLAYSESLFFFILVLAMYGMAAGWRAWLIALIVGLDTAVRPVGVALLLPFAYVLWTRSDSLKSFVRSVVFTMPLACWGLIGYMVFLHVQFGDALAFASNQSQWAMRQPASLAEQVVALASLEPIWGAYCPSNFGYWEKHDLPGATMFSLRFADPIYFTLTAILVTVGAWKRWLTREEILLAVCLLLIPYVLKSYSTAMQSQARFSSVVFPAYIVTGQLMSRCPPAVSYALYGLFAFFICGYAALFTSWYKIV